MALEKNKNEIEVFITDIKNNTKVKTLKKKIENLCPKLEVSFDIGEVDLPYPCSHTILRVAGVELKRDIIISTIIKSGFKCAILEDKVCQ